ncbi:hypothetical protein PACTADRAFT_34184 [Pachysolen tannophilus NRRL Y-2460]|uniref:AB hydrolase-1 domain-containing protein n=1 Tax=Pachysolen tannophilus NRRL Y-2460 TaxID=669874 RepID=A0A1E4TV33_PACTA|nr:hypothetical protein PACTADRAFT_34184 [Pachysolen tannophilus NRRL Y-2460]
MLFPCLDKLEDRSQKFLNESSGPEPAYGKVGKHNTLLYKSDEPIFLDYGGFLPSFEIVYETWGKLNEDKSNLILIHTGLSASSHAKSNSLNKNPGWWEGFIGPNKYLDTNKYFLVCTNVIGGCYGSTGPSSIDPSDGKRYATRFPMLSVQDMIRAQNRLIKEQFGVSKIYASIGCSMGGMQSLAYASEFPNEVGKIISVSGCARSHPYSIAMRHCQRQVLMSDPNWNRGFYYDNKIPPHTGMKLAREIGTITYRSGPEWEYRFGVERADPSRQPALCPDFLIETYLDHQGEKFCLEYDPNSMLYISKTMDLFDLGLTNVSKLRKGRFQAEEKFNGKDIDPKELQFRPVESACSIDPDTAPVSNVRRTRKLTPLESKVDLLEGMKHFSNKDILVIGVESDILFPAWQQREIVDLLRQGCKQQGLGDGSNIKHVELSEEVSMYGHDTFLLSLEHIGEPVKHFLEG